MKHKMKKITIEQLNNYRDITLVNTYRAYCDLHSCCEECNPKVKFLCKIRNGFIDRLARKIILKEVMKNDI